MKVITRGKRHWSTEVTCLNLQCLAGLEVEEHDFFMAVRLLSDGSLFEKGIHFTCPECLTHNPVHRAILDDMPEWVYLETQRRRKEA